jgi:hypothetical protein
VFDSAVAAATNSRFPVAAAGLTASATFLAPESGDTVAIVGISSAAAAEGVREAMKAAISILDCSIISLTLGENLTPKEKSLASLLMSGPF